MRARVLATGSLSGGSSGSRPGLFWPRALLWPQALFWPRALFWLRGLFWPRALWPLLVLTLAACGGLRTQTQHLSAPEAGDSQPTGNDEQTVAEKKPKKSATTPDGELDLHLDNFLGFPRSNNAGEPFTIIWNSESPVPLEPDLAGPCTSTSDARYSPGETNVDYSKDMVNAQVAYDLGLSGNCQIAVVLDSGLTSIPHSELPRDRIYSISDYEDGIAGPYCIDGFDPVLEECIGRVYASLDSQHGTAVSGVVAGQANAVGMHGVAPSGIVRMIDVFAGDGGGGDYSPTPLEALETADASLASLFELAHELGPVLNMSWVYTGSISATKQDGSWLYTEEDLRRIWPEFIRVAAQAYRHPDARRIYVWAAGNYGNTEGATPSAPELTGGLPARIAELKGHWLVVVAVGASGSITGFSNRCGIAAEWCLAAPGANIRAPLTLLDEGGHPINYTSLTSGTSFAAPIVTGALLLMMERFRGQLGNTDLVSRLLATANKTGIYANQSIYGQGLLDIGAAVQPVGQSYLSLSGSLASLSSLNSRIIDDSGTLALLSSALGGTEIMVKDELGAPFWHAFQSLPGGRAQRQLPQPQNTLRLDMRYSQGWRHLQVSDPNSRTPGYLLDARPLGGDTALFASAGVQPGWALGAYSAGLRPGDFGNSTAFSAPWMPLLSDGSIGGGATVRTGAGRLTAALFQGGAGQAAAWQGAENSLAAVEYQQRFGNLRLITQAGLLAESDSWRGVQTSGSLYGGFQARTSYVGATGVLPFGDWTLLGALHHSNTDARPSTPGLIQQISGLSDTVLELGALGRSLWQRGDSLGLYLTGQRLDGQVQWQLPVRLQRRQTIYSDLTTDLAGSDRHSLNLHYRLPLDDRTLLSWHLRRGYNLWGSESSRTLSFSHRF